MKLYKLARKYGARAAAAVGTGLVTLQVNAASEFPTDLAEGFATDVGLTISDFKAWLIGIVFVVGLAMFAVNMTKKGLGKAGAR